MFSCLLTSRRVNTTKQKIHSTTNILVHVRLWVADLLLLCCYAVSESALLSGKSRARDGWVNEKTILSNNNKIEWHWMWNEGARSKTMKMIFTLNLYSNHNRDKESEGFFFYRVCVLRFRFGAVANGADETSWWYDFEMVGFARNVNKTLEFARSSYINSIRKNTHAQRKRETLSLRFGVTSTIGTISNAGK